MCLPEESIDPTEDSLVAVPSQVDVLIKPSSRTIYVGQCGEHNRVGCLETMKKEGILITIPSIKDDLLGKILQVGF